MRVLVTGHHGYIGSVLTPMLVAAGHEVVGLDNYLFADCDFLPDVPQVPAHDLDVRDVEVDLLRGFDAVIHLAGLSNDPLGDLNPECTYDINYHASVRLAEFAKEAGVRRFVFSSSCSNYGAAGDDLLNELAPFNPVTPYGRSKVMVEAALDRMADHGFSPTFLRNATAYGVSPRLRADLVVNNLVGYAVTTGAVLIKSDGMPWRPLVHIEDISRAFVAVLEAPRKLVHNQAFNVGRTEENYRVREVAGLVEAITPGCKVEYSNDAQPDVRNYRVNCDKITTLLPSFQPKWTVREGIKELYAAFRRHRLTLDQFLGSRFLRIKRIRELQAEGRLDTNLRYSPHALAQR